MKKNKVTRKMSFIWLILVLALVILSCNYPATSYITPTTGDDRQETSSQPPPKLTNTPVDTPLPSETALPAQTSSPTPQTSIWLSPNLPNGLVNSLKIPADLVLTNDPGTALITYAVGDQNQVSQWVYVLVAPFPNLTDSVIWKDLMSVWKTGINSGAITVPILLDQNTHEALSAWLGTPSESAVYILPTGNLLEYAWGQNAFALIPFELLEPKWKVISINDQSPIRPGYDQDKYPLVVPVSYSSNDSGLAQGINIPESNFERDKITSVAITGVTALVRATAFTMEIRGITYPAEDVGKLLRSADITHISNEVPFAENCPPPDPVQENLIFCSDPDYIKLLEVVGADVIELTGDHFHDWGNDAMFLTLQIYQDKGFKYYGGGANVEEGKNPLIIEHNSNKIAFIGCNAKGFPFARASAYTPGSVACDLDWMEEEIKSLRSKGILPIVTFQHFEYYTYYPLPNQIEDLRRVADAGAVIVSGSQAHQPKSFEFRIESLIHYGLGNLFFDQFSVCQACNQAFIDFHVFYNGEHISTFFETIQFIDYAKPRLMTEEERIKFLKIIFDSSGW